MIDPKKTERFRELGRMAAPLQREVAEIGLEMAQLSQKASVEILSQAYPQAAIMTIKACSEIKPTDFAKSAELAVGMMAERGIIPDMIIIDESRMTVTLAIQQTYTDGQSREDFRQLSTRTADKPKKAKEKKSSKTKGK